MDKKIICIHCTNSDDSMMEIVYKLANSIVYLCSVCSKTFVVKK